jgi:hypothetical protein
MKITLSYCLEDTDRLHSQGFTLIGISSDAHGKDVLVFQEKAIVAPDQIIPATDVMKRLIDYSQTETNPDTRMLLDQACRQLFCLHRIHSLLDGTEYDASTASEVATWLADAGFEIRDPDEMDDEEEE